MSGIVGGAGSRSGVIGTTELDYEEGTYTPTYSNFVSNVSGTEGSLSAHRGAHYVRIGKRCMVSVNAYILHPSGGDQSFDMTLPPNFVNAEGAPYSQLNGIVTMTGAQIGCGVVWQDDGQTNGCAVRCITGSQAAWFNIEMSIQIFYEVA